MNCLFCKTGKTKVIDTATSTTKVLRRRKCLACNKTFVTEEIGYISNTKLCSELNRIRKMGGIW